MNIYPPYRCLLISQNGFSQVEVLLAVVLVAVSLVPMLEALQPAITGSAVQQQATTQGFQLRGKMEEMLAESFSHLAAAAAAVGDPTVPTTYSDAVGSDDRRLVFLSTYDGDNADGDDDPFTGQDEGLIWVRVISEGAADGLENLVAQ